MAASQFSYQACDVQGKMHAGQLSAETEQEVVAILQARNLIPIKIEAAGSALSNLRRKSVNTKDVIDFTSGLCTLVEAHVPLDKALGLLEGITEKSAVRSLVVELRREVKEGRSLADALQDHPAVFSRMYVNMIHAGEEGGILEKLLPRLAKFMEEADEAKRTVISALIYPMILLVVGVLSVIALMVFVVPQFATLFEDMGAAIPPSAALLLGLSDWLQNYGWTLIFMPFVVAYAWKEAGATPERKLKRDAFLLKLPLMGSLILEAETSRFCRTLGSLLGSGIPLLKALHIAQGVMENQLLAKDLEEVEETVRRGVSLGKALSNSGHFPVLLPQLIVVGEESGRTAGILDKLAESFDEQVRQRTRRMVALVEPLLILGLGGIVGAVVIIMLSAIFSLNSVGV